MHLRPPFLALLLFALVLPALASQTPVTRAWGKSYDLGQSDPDGATALCVDSAGNVYVASTNGLDGTADILNVTKFNQYGTVVWSTESYLPFNSAINGITSDLSGNVYVGGKSDTSSGGAQMLTIKFYDGGAMAWIRFSPSGKGEVQMGNSIYLDPQGQVHVAGWGQSGSTYGTGILIYQSDGTQITNVLDANASNPTTTFDQNGYLIATGVHEGSTYGGTGFAVFKPSGVLLLHGTLNNTSTNSFSYMGTADSTGHFYLTTQTTTSPSNAQSFVIHEYDELGTLNLKSIKLNGHIDQIAAGDPDHFYVERTINSTTTLDMFDHTGAVKWSVPFNDNFFVADAVNGVLSTVSTSGGFTLTRRDLDGNVMWSQTYTNPAGPSYLSVLLPMGTASYVAGITTNAGTGDDALILKYTEGIGLSSVSLSPNPTTNAGVLNGTVTLNGPAPTGGFDVHMLSNYPSIIDILPTIVIPEGATFAKFSLNTAIVDNDTSVTITAQANGVSRWASVLVKGPTAKTLVPAQGTVKGGQSLSFTLSLTGPTGLAGKNVSLSGSPSSVLVLPSSVTVPPGKSFVTFNVGTKAVATNTSASVTATVGSAATASFTVTP